MVSAAVRKIRRVKSQSKESASRRRKEAGAFGVADGPKKSGI